jgi:uncharacterized membrane protein
MFPPIPGWAGLHPLIIHFPIALLIFAPVFVVLAIVFPRARLALALSAGVLMLAGTIAAFVAIEAGQAAAELADRSEAIAPVLERHESLAEQTRNVFAALTLIYAAALLAPRFTKKKQWGGRAFAIMSVLFLAIYSGGVLLLVNTAHHGGVLVHQFGVHSVVAPLD